jgi:methyl-accepting chemotaxis protein
MLSPSATARRVDRMFAAVLAGLLLTSGLALGLTGQPLAPWALGATLGGALAAVLLRRWGGTSVAAWGLSGLVVLAALGLVGGLSEMSLAAAVLLVMSLLPQYRRWTLVTAAGLVLAPTPWWLGLPGSTAGHAAFAVLVLAQTLLLALVAQRNERVAREAWDVDFLVRAMGSDGAIRLDLGVLRAETALGQRLKLAQERMAAILLQVRESAAAASEAARRLQDSGQELTQRSQSAGGELSAAAMTLTQIALIVKESADAAMAARQTAQQASAMAEAGGQTVGSMVDQMQAIDTASRRVTEIIGVIESIAFQTNILALNAAVEAARAGEQGRGFAVVAAEVRSLAQRASRAAGEVKVLVDDTVQAVSRGNALAASAGATIRDLTATVARVDQTFHSLSADTHEHASGIEAIRDSMDALNGATQQNLALAEQSRSIADDLAGCALSLQDGLAAFRLGGGGAGPAQPSPAAAAGAASAAASRPGAAQASAQAGQPVSTQETVEFF